MKVLALDLGSRRIGVAISDQTGTLASPFDVIPRSGDRSRDHRTVADLVRDEGVERVVVGLPRSLSGRLGPAARAALDEVDELSSVVGVPVETYDERFTTVTAHQALRAAGRGGKAARRVIDQTAAAVLLQAWLDGRREGSGMRRGERDGRGA